MQSCGLDEQIWVIHFKVSDDISINNLPRCIVKLAVRQGSRNGTTKADETEVINVPYCICGND